MLEKKIVSITFEKKGSHVFILLPSSSLQWICSLKKYTRLVEAFVLNDSSFDGSYSKDCMLTMCMTLSHDREENDSVPRVVVTCCCHSKRGNQIASVVVMTDDEQLNILNGPIVQPMMVTRGHVCS